MKKRVVFSYSYEGSCGIREFFCIEIKIYIKKKNLEFSYRSSLFR